MRIAAEATTAGWDHFAAIAFHNLGIAQRQMGLLRESLISLEKAAGLWSDLPASPFADNSELTQTCLMLNDVRRAEQAAAAGVRNTRPWPRPHAEAQLANAAVQVHQGQFAEAVDQLQQLAAMATLGTVREGVLVLLIETLYLRGADAATMKDPFLALSEEARDPRLAPEVSPALALAKHRSTRCRGGCQLSATTLNFWRDKGATLPATIGHVKLGALALDHRGSAGAEKVRFALDSAMDAGLLPYLRFWIREYGRHSRLLVATGGGASLLVRFLENDPEYWRQPLLALLTDLSGDDRAALLKGLLRFANKATLEAMARIPGQDVLDARRHLVQQLAARIYIRSFGSLTIQRGSHHGPITTIDKRRLRALLGLLVVHSRQALARDEALDLLWPEADPVAAVNSLNQSVFQLRRVLNPEHRDGETPHYLISTPEALQLNPELVHSDLDAFRALVLRWKQRARSPERRELAEAMLDIVRGEFLADLKYEEWMQQTEIGIHAEVRHALLPIAQGDAASPDIAIRAASALMLLDEFDEGAALALVHQLIASGRRLRAREVVVRFTSKLRDELGEPPSDGLEAALRALATPRRLIST